MHIIKELHFEIKHINYYFLLKKIYIDNNLTLNDTAILSFAVSLKVKPLPPHFTLTICK